MQLSANYALKLPEGTDNVKRQDFVDNFTSIDTQLKAINDNSYPGLIATGTNSYVGSTDRIKALNKFTKLTLIVGENATDNCSLNLNSWGAKNIKDSFGNIVTNLKKDIPYNLCYNGTDFILQGKGGGGNAIAAHILNGETATVDSGQIVGTMPNIVGGTDLHQVYIGTDADRFILTPPSGNYYNGGAVYATKSEVSDTIGLTPNKLMSGTSVLGVIGTATNDARLDPSYLVQGYSGYDDGVLKNGTLADLGSLQNAKDTWTDGNGTLRARVPSKGAFTDVVNGYLPEVNLYDANYMASNIVSGKSIFGLTGTATVASLGGKQITTGTVTGTGGSSYTVNVGFTIQWMIFVYGGRIWIENRGYSGVPSVATYNSSYSGTISNNLSISGTNFTLNYPMTSGTAGYYIAIGN